MEAKIRVYKTLALGIHPQDAERRDIANVGRDYVDLGNCEARFSETGESRLGVEIVQKRSGNGSEHVIYSFTVDEGQIQTYPDDYLSRLAGGKFIEIEHVSKTSR